MRCVSWSGFVVDPRRAGWRAALQLAEMQVFDDIRREDGLDANGTTSNTHIFKLGC